MSRQQDVVLTAYTSNSEVLPGISCKEQTEFAGARWGLSYLLLRVHYLWQLYPRAASLDLESLLPRPRTRASYRLESQLQCLCLLCMGVITQVDRCC